VASSVEAILDRVVADIQINHTTQSPAGDFDLSGTDAVKLGRYARPWVVPPCACVWLDAVDSSRQSDGMGGVPLRYYSRTIKIGITGWAPVTGTLLDTPDNRMRVATRLADDLMRALEKDRSLNAQVLDHEVTFETIDGEDVTVGQATGAGICQLSITAYKRVTTGV